MSQIEITNPYNLDVFEKKEFHSEAQAMQALEKAFALMQDRKKLLQPQKRIEILEKAHDILSSKKDKLIEDAVKEGGKPYSDSAVEVKRGLTGIKVAIQELSQFGGKEIMMNTTDRTTERKAFRFRQPRGVAVAISAFNHPFNLAIHQVVPAVAAGCPVIIKPAGDTPISAQTVVEAFHEAGLEKDYCQYILCENEVAEKLVTDPRTSFLSFIGSSKVGWYLRSKLSPGTVCALEHGGAAPVLIDETADLTDAVPRLVKAGYYHAGQVCVSAQRLYVHEKIKSKFIELFKEAVEKLRVGDPLDKNTDVGPLIRPQEVERMSSWVEEAKDSGAQILLGGKKISESCYEPTILLDPSDNAKVSTQEIFGPVTCIYSYQDFEEAIRRANNVDYAFQASIFSRDINRCMKAVEQLEGLAIMVNEHPAFRADWMPFGGYKDSGLGVGGIGYSMRELSIEKMMVIREIQS